MRCTPFFLTVVFFAVLGEFLSASAQAAGSERMAGTELVRLCSSSYDVDYGYCAGYITAIADQMTKSGIGEYQACNHQDIKSQQYIDVFRSYAEIFPDMMKRDAETMVAAAISRAFPCTGHP